MDNMKHKLVLLAKEKGYNRFHPAWFENNELDPETWYLEMCLLQKWLMRRRMIRVIVNHSDSTGKFNFTIYKWNGDNSIGKWERIHFIGTYAKYEQALEVGLLEGLKIIK